jgi:hypothetical protein
MVQGTNMREACCTLDLWEWLCPECPRYNSHEGLQDLTRVKISLKSRSFTEISLKSRSFTVCADHHASAPWEAV